MHKQMVPTQWQEFALSIPEACDLFCLSGRGLGKTTLLLFLILRRVQMYPGISRILVLRNTAISLGEFRMELEAICAQTYGAGVVKLNKQQGTFVFPCGALVQLGHLDDLSSTHRWQGSSWDLLAVDEAGNSDLSLVDILMGSLRSGSDIPCRLIMLGNPGGIAHHKLYQRYMQNRTIGKPHTDKLTGRPFIVLGGTAKQNKHLPDSYLASMGGIAKSNPALHAAWVSGDWSKIVSGAYFDCWDNSRVIIPSWAPGSLPPRLIQNSKLGADYGSTVPSYVAYGACVGPRPFELSTTGQVVGAGSWVFYEEAHNARDDDYSKSDGSSVQDLGAEVYAKCKAYGVRARGVIDAHDVHGTSDRVSVADLFRRQRVYFRASVKGPRKPRFDTIRELLANSGNPDRPGLYFTTACEYAITTIPEIQRHPRDPSKTAARSISHALDAISYRISTPSSRVKIGSF